MAYKYANNASTTLAAGIGTTDTSITLATGTGSRFPALTGGDIFMATFSDTATNSNIEIVKATAINGDVLTVTRAQEGTTALSFASGDTVSLRLTAGELGDMFSKSNGGTISGATTFSSQPTMSAGINTTGDSAIVSVNGQNVGAFRNRIINGDMRIDARNSGASQTITSTAAYTVDRFYASSAGANVTGQRVAGVNGTQYAYQFTGAASVTGITFGQRLESVHSYDLAGKTVTFSVDLGNSVLGSVTWTAYYANKADDFSATTQIATGTFTVSSTVSRYNTQISIPSAATTGIAIVLSVGAQTSGTWTIGNVQLEAGSTATSFQYRSYAQELALCQRYWQAGAYQFYGYVTSGYGYGGSVPLPVVMRANPTISVTNTSSAGFPATASSASGAAPYVFNLQRTSNATGAAAFSDNWTASAEL